MAGTVEEKEVEARVTWQLQAHKHLNGIELVIGHVKIALGLVKVKA